MGAPTKIRRKMGAPKNGSTQKWEHSKMGAPKNGSTQKWEHPVKLESSRVQELGFTLLSWLRILFVFSFYCEW